MPSYVTPKKNTEFIVYISLPSISTPSQFQANPTIAAGDFKVSTDGGALGNLSTLPTVTPASGKAVKITVSTSEMNGDNIIIIGSDAAGDEWRDVIIAIQTTAQQVDDMASQASVDTVDGNVDSILTDTGTTLPAQITSEINDVQTDIAALNNFDPTLDAVANVTLVATTTTNTDMRGTDGANTVAPDNTSIAAILVDTGELQTNQGNWLTATGFATETKQDISDTKIDELHKLEGLDTSNPVTTTTTSRDAGSISQVITGDGITTSTVTRP